MSSNSVIQNVIVLMMENHSFDHMLGWLPSIGELDGTQTNQDWAGNGYAVTEGADYRTNPCPQHQLVNINIQVFGTSDPDADATPTMSGFVLDYMSGIDQPDGDPAVLMGCYSSDQLPVISTLAQTYTVCTRWFCSVPGPTGPNRIFANCASSAGYAGPAYEVGSFPAEMSALPSIFGVLAEAGLTWGVYHEDADFAPELLLNDVQAHIDWTYCDPGFTTFQSHLTDGTLPTYSFLTPSLWQNSQHSPDDVRYGECVIATIYEALAASGYWQNTLLIVTYDEHGGLYDSVPTPTGVPNPDGRNWDTSAPADYGYQPPPFTFNRLGPRVPALLISPYVQAVADSTQYEHSSIAATVLALYGLNWPNGNKRLDTVNTFLAAIGDTARTDLPTTLRRPAASNGFTPPPISG
ncbi:alkaline phosphatase family protein [Nitrospirillum iridis]|uniref:Phospholipase C n=1 Tax=Nitrospirillum iridis TaxID=765888 RepID=A0A7X0B2Y6_9PROT|nr:alkaline phosphatase family protein [Nitrospirillum iridis]MBB6254765.1 phospholipase C [Nitrospirillum iridis]